MLSAKTGVVLLLVFFLAHLANATFSWTDCGVPLYKDIHYEVASISRDKATEGSPLSVNVKATISEVIYNAYTRVMVWKDNELFLDVRIADFCDIIKTTNGLSCPLAPGHLSFTYEFASVPALPSGDYTVDIRSVMGSIIEPSEVGCISFNVSVDSLKQQDSCSYTSSFSVEVAGNAVFSKADVYSRQIGDFIKVGPIDAGSSNPYGLFTSTFKGTKDLGGEMSLTGYSWGINGTLVSRQDNFTSPNQVVDVYAGDFFVLYQGAKTFTGQFNWTFDYDPDRTSRKEVVNGSMWFNPEYYIVDQFDWPVVLANLGPFRVVTAENSASGTFTVLGSHTFCTCGVDACGVCQGDGSTCGLGAKRNTNNDDDGMGIRKRAAIGCGVAAFLLILLVIYLVHRVRKAQRRIPNDDTDLIDHPEKPDYGTMAIDDAIREGERV